MSLWDWLLAAWIYEELFDEDSRIIGSAITIVTIIRRTTTMSMRIFDFLYLYTQITGIWT